MPYSIRMIHYGQLGNEKIRQFCHSTQFKIGYVTKGKCVQSASFLLTLRLAKMEGDKRYVILNNGARMPTIGMGTWHHGPREEIDAALRKVI